jgi:thiol-disulfide isomerase/thioredoxin
MLNDFSPVCPHCGTNTGFYSGPEVGLAATRTTAARGRPGLPAPWRFPVVRLSLVLFALGLLGWWFVPVQLPVLGLTPARANAAGADACVGKRRCVVVFVAPWCPACKLSVGVIRAMMEHYSGPGEVGVKPVVGSGRSSVSMEEMADQLGPGTFLDPAGSIMRAAGEKSVPHWFVVDERGFLIKKVAGLIPNLQGMIQELDLAGSTRDK